MIPVFMGFSKKYLVNHFLSGVLKYRNTAERRKKAEDRTLEWFIEANERIKAMCAEHGIRYFEIDADYDEDTKAVYHFIAAEALKLASLEGAQ